MSIPRNHLRRERFGLEPEPLADVTLDVGARMREATDRARQLPVRDLRARPRQSRAVAPELRVPVREFEPERDRLGVNPVRAADHRQVLVTEGLRANHLEQLDRDRRAADRPLPSTARRRRCPSRPTTSCRGAGSEPGRRPFRRPPRGTRSPRAARSSRARGRAPRRPEGAFGASRSPLAAPRPARRAPRRRAPRSQARERTCAPRTRLPPSPDENIGRSRPSSSGKSPKGRGALDESAAVGVRCNLCAIDSEVGYVTPFPVPALQNREPCGLSCAHAPPKNSGADAEP